MPERLIQLNRLLLRQVRKEFGSLENVPKEMVHLLQTVSRSYDHYESDRVLIERAMDLSSEELIETNSRLRTEATKLEHSEELFRLIAEASSDLIYEHLPNEGITRWFASVNPALGYTDEELPRTRDEWNKLIHAQDRVRLNGAYEKCLSTGSALDQEFRVVLTSGKIAYWREKSCIVRDDQDRIIRWCGAITDTTAQREYENELQNSKATISALVENTQDAIWSIDRDMRLVAFNSAFRKRFESLYMVRPYVGQWLEERSNPQDLQRWQEWYSRALSGERFTEEMMIDGDAIVHDFSFHPIVADGRISGVTVFSRDISEARRLTRELIAAKETAEEINRLKSSFLANMSHEIRTPMTAILGFAEHLTSHLDDTDLKDCALTIERGAKRLLETINGILDLATLESGKVNLMIGELSLAQECTRAIDLLTPLAQRKGLDLILDVPQHLVALGDDHALHRVLTNVVGNAIKFTDTGSICVSARADENDVLIVIKDTGVGISPEFLPHIFEKFKQESTGYARTFEGNGLGLAIASELLAHMKGSITASSEKNGGTEMQIRLPIVRQSSLAESYVAPRFSSLPSSGLRVLLIEDHEDAVDLFKAHTGEMCIVEVAGDAMAAYERASVSLYDMIFVDINLGRGPSGLDVTAWLRALPHTKSIPIIALTAYAMPEDHDQAIVSGCDLFLTKPYTRDELLRAMREALDLKRSQTAQPEHYNSL